MILFSNAPLQRRDKIHAIVLAVTLAMIFVFSGAAESLRTLLPECLFRSLTGLPCPSCGLTRSFHAVSRFDFTRAAAYHLFGPFLYLVLFLLFIVSVLRLLTNRKLLQLHSTLLRLLLLLFLVFYVGVWIYGLVHA